MYEWIDNKHVKNDIVDFINIEQPNILCLQEFYAPNELPNIELPYQHIGLQSKQKQWRMATYSRFPIIAKGTVALKGNAKIMCVFTPTWSPLRIPFVCTTYTLPQIGLVKLITPLCKTQP